jgi:hypothetical protein
MQNRRERRKLLRQFGLLKPYKPFSENSSISSAENGRELHRQNLQDMKNNEIAKIKSEKPDSIQDNEIFTYRNESNEYGSFQSMLLSKDWEKIENS